MSPDRFVSYAQNGEDVILWRALGDIEKGRYVDIGANHPTVDSVTRAFYDRGWRGLNVEPVEQFVEALTAERPEDIIEAVAVTTEDHGETTFHEVPDTGLSSLDADVAHQAAGRGYTTRTTTVPTRTLASLVDQHLREVDVHFCKIDVEGAEAEVLASVDLTKWRPWVLVVEATRPNTTEPTFEEWDPAVLEAGYEFCLFDGLSRYYVAREHADSYRAALGHPASAADGFVRASDVERDHKIRDLESRHHQAVTNLAKQVEQKNALRGELDALRHDLVMWRRTALESWGVEATPATSDDEVAMLRTELDAVLQTVSWRVTRPLRAVRSRLRSTT